MLPEQRPFALVTAFLLLASILYLIWKRKLREEYALLWLFAGAAIIVLAIWYKPLQILARLIGAVDPTSALFLFAIIFLLVISIHFSVVNSRLKDQVKDLTQELALLRHELETRFPAAEKKEKTKPPEKNENPGA